MNETLDSHPLADARSLYAQNLPAEGEPHRLNEFQQEKVVQYLKLVKWVVTRMSGRLPHHIDSEDLIHSGILGLIDAVQRFQWGRDKEDEEFRAYAECRVRGQIMDELRRLDVLPRSARAKVSQFKRAHDRLSQELKREPTDIEISEHLGIDIENIHRMRAEASFGRQVTLEALHTTGDVIEEFLQKTLDLVAPNTPEGLLHVEQVKRILAEELDRLEERERQVVSLYYLEEMTLKEIGLVLSVTESRISQIHGAAMGKLMKRLRQSLSPEIAFAETLT